MAWKSKRGMCPNCKRSDMSINARSLCHSCYKNLGIRKMYPSIKKFANRGTGLGNRQIRMPTEGCPYPPGSEGKIACMEKRAEEGVSLFSSLDEEAKEDKE